MTELTTQESNKAARKRTEPAELAIFPTQITADEAESLLATTDDDLTRTTVIETLYYPYQIFDFRVQAEALFNSLDQELVCGVDLCREKALLLDEDPESVVKSVPCDRILPIRHEDVLETARSYLTTIIHRRLTISQSITLAQQNCYRRYRPFYRTECQTKEGVNLQYIVDGITGAFHRVHGVTESP